MYPEEERVMKVIMDAIRGIRNSGWRLNVPANRRAKAIFVTSDPDLASAVDREAPRLNGLPPFPMRWSKG